MPLPANCFLTRKFWKNDRNRQTLGFKGNLYGPNIIIRVCWWTTSLYTNTKRVVPWWNETKNRIHTEHCINKNWTNSRKPLGEFWGRAETSFNEKNIKRTGAVKDGNVKTRLYTINTQKNGNFNNDGQIREEARKSFIDHCALKKHALRCREG